MTVHEPLLDDLRAQLRTLDRVVVAFSGGVDSGYLAWLARDTLGPDRVLAVTAVSPSLATAEREDCNDLAREWGLTLIEIETAEMENAAYRRNDLDRCFWCKDALMDAVGPVAAEFGGTVILGVNTDDLSDHRPGQKAAADRGARFPFVDASWSKAHIRAAAAAAGLRIWDKPAAPCLASRLPYGTEVTLGRLRSVEAAETAIKALGFGDVRVRHHGQVARVEVPAEFLAEAISQREAISMAVHDAGYRWATIDLDGLRSGNLNPI
jgi:uncharacterized protein